MRRIRLGVGFVLGLLALGTAGAVLAYTLDDEGVIDSGAEVHGSLHHQHGGTEGHLAATSKNVRLVGKMNVNQDFEGRVSDVGRSEEHTSELQSRQYLVCRLLLE